MLNQDQWRSFKTHHDNRGSLVALDQLTPDLPFEVRRVFWVSVPPLAKRGGHYHVNETQLLVCVQGQIYVQFDDAPGYILEFQHNGIIIKPYDCVNYRNMSAIHRAAVLVLSSELYDPGDTYECPPKE